MTETLQRGFVAEGFRSPLCAVCGRTKAEVDIRGVDVPAFSLVHLRPPVEAFTKYACTGSYRGRDVWLVQVCGACLVDADRLGLEGRFDERWAAVFAWFLTLQEMSAGLEAGLWDAFTGIISWWLQGLRGGNLVMCDW